MKHFLIPVLICSFLVADPLLRALPTPPELDPAKVRLGKRLFYDPILSVDNTVSCATCHDLANGGDDGLPVSFGVEGRQGSLNAPTVLNALFNFRQFWDGRAADLKEQAKGPITNPVEMANSFERLVATLKNSPYRGLFEKIYPDGVTEENIVDAIAEFEKSLVTPSPFDRYLAGDESALTPDQKEGYRIFREKGCVVCHHGVNLGGTMYSRFGIVGSDKKSGEGRYAMTKNPEDRNAFKVPTLRNVALTAPYFHDGRTETLTEAVAIMANLQLGRSITREEVRLIVRFLDSLTGEVPKEALP